MQWHYRETPRILYNSHTIDPRSDPWFLEEHKEFVDRIRREFEDRLANLPTIPFTDVLPREEWAVDEIIDEIAPAVLAEPAGADPLDLAELYDNWK